MAKELVRSMADLAELHGQIHLLLTAGCLATLAAVDDGWHVRLALCTHMAQGHSMEVRGGGGGERGWVWREVALTVDVVGMLVVHRMGALPTIVRYE